MNARPRPRCFATRLRNAALTIGVVGALAGCGGGSSTAHTSTTGASTSSTPSSAAASPSSVVAGGTAHRGATVSTHSPAGYIYELSATAPSRTATVTVGGAQQSAPPGKSFLSVAVTVTNPLADRPEPLQELVSDASTAFAFALPVASLPAFGFSATNTQYTCESDSPAGYCIFLTETAVSSVSPTGDSSGQTQIQPGSASSLVVTLVTADAPPETAPLADLALFVSFVNQPPTRIALGA